MTIVSMLKRRFWVFALLMALAVALVPTEAFAATKTVRTYPSYAKSKTVVAKATALKKGKNTVKFKKGTGVGVMKFKAPKTKYYTFTFSNVKSTSGTVVGSLQLGRLTPTTSASIRKFKTSEGTRSVVPLLSKDIADGSSFTYSGYTFQRLATRKVRIKVKKGQNVFFFTSFEDLNGNNVVATAKVYVK